MSSTQSQIEAAVLETFLPDLEAEGFAVFVHPSPKMLPPFLRAHRPNAIAFKEGRKLAIEVVTPQDDSAARMERLRKLLEEHGDWKLEVLYASPQIAKQLPVASRATIEDQLDRILKAFEEVGPTASLLIAWSVFEAAARSMMPDTLGRPQTPVRLLDVLAADGTVTPDEADALRRLGRLRNEAAHGRLDVEVTREDLEILIGATRTVLDVADSDRENVPVTKPVNS